jgi:hypothetical protein
MANGYKDILNETFEDSDDLPDNWNLISAGDKTWQHVDYDAHWGEACAYCFYSGDYDQNERLQTPPLNFADYNEIYLRFWWVMGSWYYAAWEDTQSLNVRISTDGGSNWKKIWHEDYWNTLENRFYNDEWYNTNRSARLDLGEYIGETNVIIEFQVESVKDVDGGYIAIDDIYVTVDDPENPNPLICSAGGPYEGECDQTIIFQGEASGGQKPYYWEWDFGDGNRTSGFYKDKPVHTYLEKGDHDVYLKVTSMDGGTYEDNTTASIILPEGTKRLKIHNLAVGIGVTAEITCITGNNATDVNWTIHAYGGLINRNRFERTKTGHFDRIDFGKSKKISCRYFIGFGIFHIKISVEAANAKCADKDFTLIKFGPFMLGFYD